MNPKPFSSLNHFTVPVAIVLLSGVVACCERRDFPKAKATKPGAASVGQAAQPDRTIATHRPSPNSSATSSLRVTSSMRLRRSYRSLRSLPGRPRVAHCSAANGARSPPISEAVEVVTAARDAGRPWLSVSALWCARRHPRAACERRRARQARSADPRRAEQLPRTCVVVANNETAYRKVGGPSR